MAVDTPTACSSAVIYQCFVRNHSPQGTLAAVAADVGRIADLGATVLYLMPLSPIGERARKGALGSPYAIRDYRAIDPALGSEQDFAGLVEEAGRHGIRVMLDVVFNHTSPDSVLAAQHPEFFHRDVDGNPISTVPEWSDVIDLDFRAPGLADYLIDTLRTWVDRGVRGFRCDVASLVPIGFWMRARAAIAEHAPDVWWLTESPHPSWVTDRRERGLPTEADSEMFAAFDIAYSYDLWPIWQSAVRGEVAAGRFLEMVRWQRATLPAHAVKLRYVENHDNDRIMRFAPNRDAALAWTALMAFLPGPFMLYAGQESGASKLPELFERDPIAWGDYGLTGFFRRLTAVVAARSGVWRVVASEPVVQLAWSGPDGGLLGIFDIAGAGEAQVALPDGAYEDLYGAQVQVAGGAVRLPGPATVLRYGGQRGFQHQYSPLLDAFS